VKKINRREFIEAVAGIGAALFLGGCGSKEQGGAASGAVMRKPKRNIEGLVVASGADPEQNTRAALDALGGMGKLVEKGNFVVIKPNIAWNRPPEAAATTNPKVVAELVRMCKEAGAGRILVVDHMIDRPAEGVTTVVQMQHISNGVKINFCCWSAGSFVSRWSPEVILSSSFFYNNVRIN